ncbi:MAG: hypothetical protein ACFCGT_05180 [Sandaracinaceae bacterium]
MSWRDRWRGSAGPFVRAAESFLATHPGAPASLPSGPEGLRRLVAALDAWAEGDAVGDEEAFVEGAGAALALLLLDAVGEGGHLARGPVHRLRLGADGFVDPFAAVEAALDADAAAPSIADAVRRAEAEARGRAGLGRLMPRLRVLLARLDPPRRLVDAFGPEVRLDDGITLDLRRTLTATDGEPVEALDASLARLLDLLPGVRPAGAGWAEAEGRLLPRLVAPAFGQDLPAPLALRPVWGGVAMVGLVLAYGDRSRFLRSGEVAGWGLRFDEALRHALTNLAARSASARWALVTARGEDLLVSRSGDGLDAARALLPGLHEVLASELGSPVAVAVPHRDALWATAWDRPAAVEALAARAARDCRRAPHPVTATLLRLDEGGLRVRGAPSA